MRKLIRGAVCGAIATVPMTIFMKILHRSVPSERGDPLPPKQITKNAAELVGLEENLDKGEIQILTNINHFGFGGFIGALYELTEADRKASLSDGINYGLKVWGTSYLGWLPLIGLHKNAVNDRLERNALMIAGHVIWGL